MTQERQRGYIPWDCVHLEVRHSLPAEPHLHRSVVLHRFLQGPRTRAAPIALAH